MIRFNFSISNPWSDRWEILWGKFNSISRYKAWEFNVYETHDIIEVDFHYTVKGDHAGLHLMLGLVGYAVEFHIYDTRHWDYENNTWEIYGDEDA